MAYEHKVKPLIELLQIDSPTGYTYDASQFIYDYLVRLGCSPTVTKKGIVKCSLSDNPVLAVTAHFDTLGALVSRILPNGTLGFSRIGGLLLNTFEGSYVKVRTYDGKVYSGTLLLHNPSAHANNQSETISRSHNNMFIRIDEPVKNRSDVEKLGIMNGNYISFDPKTTYSETGFIKSHFLDNKAGCFVLFEVIKELIQAQMNVPVEFLFTNYEEVGHGGAGGYAATIEELLVIDMGVIGNDCSGDEYSCSICAKDSGGPYDYDMTGRLVTLAQEKKIPFHVDVYPHYSSDGTAALRAGHDYKVALIGPGINASHGMERTHVTSIEATINLCKEYILKLFGKS